MKAKILFSLVLIISLLSPASGMAIHMPSAPTDEAISIIRQNCDGHSNCYTSLAAWEAAYGGLPDGDLVTQDKIAVAQIEGTWTQADTTPLELSGWTTDASHYIKIYTTNEARHNGTPGSGYRLQTTGDESIYSNVAYFRIEGLEIHGLSNNSLIYARPGADVEGEMHFSHNLIHGNGTDSGSGIHTYDYDGTLKVWNNIIYDVGGLGYQAGIQTTRGTNHIYNNTIVDVIAGCAIRTGDDGIVIVKNNLTEAPNDDFSGSFYPGSDFNASSDVTAPGFNSRREQTFSFVDGNANDFHLASTDAGARNYGTDLSSDANIPFGDDIDGLARSGGWDIGADEAAGGTDIIPPLRSDGAPAGTLPSSTTQVTITLSTNEAATCRYATTPGVVFDSMPNTFSLTGGVGHAHQVNGLVDEQTYTYYIKCQDTAGNTNEDDYEISFYIFSSDIVPPVISNVQAVNINPYSVEIRWETDEPATSQIAYGEMVITNTFSPISSTRVTSHSLVLVGLNPATTYHFRVYSQDVAYNETASNNDAFTTATLENFYYVNQKHTQAADDAAHGKTADMPWLTIQHAAEVAQPGDTIIVYPGDYGRTAIQHGGTITQPITFKGLNVPDRSLVNITTLFDPAHPVQIPGNATLNAVTKGFDLAPATGITTPVGYVRIENFEVTAIGSVNGQGGFRLHGTDHVEIIRNFVHDLNPDPAGYGYKGIRPETHDNMNVVIKDNTFYRVQGTGISTSGENWLVEGNEVSHSLDANTDTGAHVGGDSDAIRLFGSRHIIRNNFLHDSLDEEQYGDPHIDCFQTFAVYPDSQFAHDILLEGNRCENFGQMLMISDNEEGNYVHHLTFRNNIFRGARAFAINGSKCEYFTFVNNIIADSNYGAVGLNNSHHMTVVNNIFYNNGSGSQVRDEDSKIGTVWDYNIHYPDFSNPSKQPAFDQNSLFGIDPQFVNPATGDYHLQATSQAIDAGIPLPEFNYDMTFVRRPQGQNWDIGPYELLSSIKLHGTPADQTIYLAWEVNASLPPTTTWTITYQGTPGTPSSPITAIPESTRTYTITNVTNYELYTIILTTVGVTPILSDTIQVIPTDQLLYLPLIQR